MSSYNSFYSISLPEKIAIQICYRWYYCPCFTFLLILFRILEQTYGISLPLLTSLLELGIWTCNEIFVSFEDVVGQEYGWNLLNLLSFLFYFRYFQRKKNVCEISQIKLSLDYDNYNNLASISIDSSGKQMKMI